MISKLNVEEIQILAEYSKKNKTDTYQIIVMYRFIYCYTNINYFVLFKTVFIKTTTNYNNKKKSSVKNR